MHLIGSRQGLNPDLSISSLQLSHLSYCASVKLTVNSEPCYLFLTFGFKINFLFFEDDRNKFNNITALLSNFDKLN